MPLTATTSQGTQIPPDIAAVLGDAPIHPELLRRAPKRPAPTAAMLTEAALAFADLAATELRGCFDAASLAAHDPTDGDEPSDDTVDSDVLHSGVLGGIVAERRSLGAEGIIHYVGKGGVLHLKPTGSPRAISLVRGVLAQRCAQRPSLRPGAVRLVPAGHALTLADLAGDGAVAVEVLF